MYTDYIHIYIYICKYAWNIHTSLCITLDLLSVLVQVLFVAGYGASGAAWTQNEIIDQDQTQKTDLRADLSYIPKEARLGAAQDYRGPLGFILVCFGLPGSLPPLTLGLVGVYNLHHSKHGAPRIFYEHRRSPDTNIPTKFLGFLFGVPSRVPLFVVRCTKAFHVSYFTPFVCAAAALA